MIIDNIINFISNDGELDQNIVPEMDLISILDQMPVKLYPAIYNCVEYITEISEWPNSNIDIC